MAEFAGNERYEVLGRLGQGGMGTVHAAFDRLRQRRVALKVLRDPERGSLFRFKREFRAMADLRHPNLVRLYDLGVLPDLGGFFFTMEVIEGLELREWARTRTPGAAALAETAAATSPTRVVNETWTSDAAAPSPPGVALEGAPELARVLTGVVEGLAFLHRARKVHRDLKPSNVLVDGGDRARLLDFGILRELDQQGGLTAQGALGTPLYMSPEQVSGDEVGPPADLYALGCMLYELLAGQPPFTGSTTRVLMRHVREDPAPPSSLRPCDPALEALCLDLLKKGPGARPSSDEALDRLWEVAGACKVRPPAAPARLPLDLRGRDAELARVERAATAAGVPRVVLVTGESGAGRSAFLAELAGRQLAAGAAVWPGHCYEREQLPYKAFDEVIDAAAVELVRRGAQGAALLPPGAASLARLFPVLRECPAIGQLPPETTLRDPQAERERAMGALFELLANLSPGPPLVIIDDIERADPDSIEVLAWLARSEGAPPCCVLAALRDDDAGNATSTQVRARLAMLQAERRVEVVRLEPLPAEVVRELVVARASVPLEDTQQAGIVELARGNPSLAVELACAVTPDDAAAGAVPTPAELVARRLARVSREAAAVVEVAAVAGGPTSFGLLATASGLAPAALADAIDELVHGHLLREVPSARGEEGWALVHERLRAAAYERVAPDRRRALHRALAERLAHDDDAPRAVVHWQAAGEPARARAAALEAARAAEAKLAFGRAADLYALALATDEGADGPGAGPDRAALEEARGRALARAGRHGDAAAALEQAAALLGGARARDLRLDAATERLAAGDIARGLAGLDGLLAPRGDSTRRARAACLLSVSWRFAWLCLAFFVSDLLALIGVRRARRAPSEDEAFALRLYDAAHHHLAVPQPLLAEVFGLKHAMLARRHADPMHLGRARIGHALMLSATFGPLAVGRAMHHLSLGEALCHESGDVRGLLQGHMVRGFMYLLDSNWEGTRLTAARADDLARRAGLFGEPVLMTLHLMRIGCELWCGDLPALVRHAERDLEQARRRGNVSELAWPLAMKGYVLLWQGQPERGAEALEEALRVTPAEPFTLVRLMVELLALARFIHDDRPAEGLAALADIEQRWSESRLVVTSLESATYRVQRARLHLLARRHGLDPGCRLRDLVALGLLPAPSSLRDEALRLKAATALQAGSMREALGLVQRSVCLADRRNNRFSLSLALAARATLRARLGLPGAALDRERAAEELAAIGAPGCYLLRVEGWDDPASPPA